jgi:MoaA/NifB/PqqE/SkfB family radical SAM enzyme
MMTYKCQVACPHCVVEAGPHRTEEVTRDNALDWIGQIAAYGDGWIQALSLTGGEPFFNVDNLRTISSFASDCGLFVSAVTNAYWAADREHAVALLKDLDGLKMLAISTDEHHQRQIPFEWVKNAIMAARLCGIPYNVVVCTESKEDAEYKRIVGDLVEITDPATIMTVITFPVGRALQSVDASRYQRVKEPAQSACLAATAPILFPDGKVVACIGPVINLNTPHPLALGSLREQSLEEILDAAEVNPILHAIRIWGPRKLVSLAQEAGLGQYLPDTFVKHSICHACYCLMSDARIAEFLSELATDAEFREKVAYGRVYYLRETKAVQMLGLVEQEAA